MEQWTWVTNRRLANIDWRIHKIRLLGIVAWRLMRLEMRNVPVRRVSCSGKLCWMNGRDKGNMTHEEDIYGLDCIVRDRRRRQHREGEGGWRLLVRPLRSRVRSHKYPSWADRQRYPCSMIKRARAQNRCAPCPSPRSAFQLTGRRREKPLGRILSHGSGP